MAHIIKGDANFAFGIIPSERVRCDFGEVLRVRCAAKEFATVVVRERDAIRVRLVWNLDGVFVPAGHIIEELQSNDAPLIKALARAEVAEAERDALREELAQARADREIKVANLTEERDAYKASSDIRGENLAAAKAREAGLREALEEIIAWKDRCNDDRQEVNEMVVVAERALGDAVVIGAGIKAGMPREEAERMAKGGITDTQRLDWLEKRAASLCFTSVEEAEPEVIEPGWSVGVHFTVPGAETDYRLSDAYPTAREAIDISMQVVEGMENPSAPSVSKCGESVDTPAASVDGVDTPAKGGV